MLRFEAILQEKLVEMHQHCTITRPICFLRKLPIIKKSLLKWLGYFDKFILFPWVLNFKIRSKSFDIIHICDHSNAPYLRWVPKKKQLITCHDLLAIQSSLGLHPENITGWSGRIFQSWIKHSLKRAQAIAFVSKKTKNDFEKLIGKTPLVAETIYNGLNYPYAPIEDNKAKFIISEKIPHALDEAYFLHVGSNNWYKNRQGLIEIFAYLKNHFKISYKLILVGKMLSQELYDYAKKLNCENAIIQTGPISNQLLNAFYSKAEYLIFPSLEEGFGWPVIEAMASGCRVITTEKAPMSEVAENAALYLAPYPKGKKNQKEWAKNSAEIIFNKLNLPIDQKYLEIEKGLAQSKKFSTSMMATQYLELYQKIIQKAS